VFAVTVCQTRVAFTDVALFRALIDNIMVATGTRTLKELRAGIGDDEGDVLLINLLANIIWTVWVEYLHHQTGLYSAYDVIGRK
jgi:hypothetical protein